MGNVPQQPQGFQRCLWCHEGEPAEQEVPQARLGGTWLTSACPFSAAWPFSCILPKREEQG